MKEKPTDEGVGADSVKDNMNFEVKTTLTKMTALAGQIVQGRKDMTILRNLVSDDEGDENVS